jgi:hypothetical protein
MVLYEIHHLKEFEAFLHTVLHHILAWCFSSALQE